MPDQTEVFETLPQAAERIKRQRLEALEKRFPPRWVWLGWRRSLIAYAEAAIVVLTLLLIFTGLTQRRGMHIDRTTAAVIAYAIAQAYGEILKKQGHWLERRWRRRHPGHPYATAEARETAIAKASNARSLRAAAVSEFTNHLTRRIKELSEGERCMHSLPSRTAVEVAIHQAHELKEYLEDPSCYRGMNFLHSGPKVRVIPSENSSSAGADLPQDPDHDYEDRWYEEIVMDYKNASSS